MNYYHRKTYLQLLERRETTTRRLRERASRLGMNRSLPPSPDPRAADAEPVYLGAQTTQAGAIPA